MKRVAVFVVSAVLSGAANYMLLSQRIRATDALAREGIDKIYCLLLTIPSLRISAEKFKNGAVRYYESSNSSAMDNDLFIQWNEEVRCGERK